MERQLEASAIVSWIITYGCREGYSSRVGAKPGVRDQRRPCPVSCPEPLRQTSYLFFIIFLSSQHQIRYRSPSIDLHGYMACSKGHHLPRFVRRCLICFWGLFICVALVIHQLITSYSVPFGAAQCRLVSYPLSGYNLPMLLSAAAVASSVFLLS